MASVTAASGEGPADQVSYGYDYHASASRLPRQRRQKRATLSSTPREAAMTWERAESNEQSDFFKKCSLGCLQMGKFQ